MCKDCRYKNYRDWLTEQDLFGHQVQMNFNQKGPTHNTCIGGFFSIIVKIAMLVYIFLRFKALLLYEEDINTTEMNVIDLDELDPIDFKTTNM